MQSIEILYKLQRIALGNETDLSLPDSIDWEEVIKLSYSQAVPVQTCEGLESLYEKNPDMSIELDSPKYEDLRFEWCGQKLVLEELNKQHDKRVAQLTKIFAEHGFRTCLLKGQGCALMYPNPSVRNCGDIDLWVEGGRNKVLALLKDNWNVHHIVNHHAEVDFFKDVAVEIHYIPAWLYNPIKDAKLQRFFNEETDAQFSNMTEKGFAVPTIKFNLVYLAVHLYKHIYEGNVTLKQLTDYYYLLKQTTDEERQNAYLFFKELGLEKYIAFLMFRLKNDLGLADEFLLCQPHKYHYRPLSEMVWLYPWKIAHWVWRKWR